MNKGGGINFYENQQLIWQGLDLPLGDVEVLSAARLAGLLGSIKLTTKVGAAYGGVPSRREGLNVNERVFRLTFTQHMRERSYLYTLQILQL